MSKPTDPADYASPFDCRSRRHKVLAGDGICVVCGARGVIDARQLPTPFVPIPAAEPLTADPAETD